MRKLFMKDNFDQELYRLIQEKKKCLEELKQIENESHPTYVLSVKKNEEKLHNEILKLRNMCQFKIDEINQEHEMELKLLEKEATDYYHDYIDHSIQELESKKKVLENEKNTIDINSSGGDILEIKPVNTRKLRRRAQDSTCINESISNANNVVHDSLNVSTNSFLGTSITIGSGFMSNFNPDISQMFGIGQGLGASSISVGGSQPNEFHHQVDAVNSSVSSSAKKKRLNGNILTTHLNTMLPESSIYSDLLKIQRQCTKVSANNASNSSSSSAVTPTGKRHSSSALHTMNLNDKQLYRSSERSDSLPQIWVDDGRLFFGNKCISQNMNVMVESRDNSINKSLCTVVCIGVQDVSLKRVSDNGIFKVSIQHIKNGKTQLYPCNASGAKKI